MGKLPLVPTQLVARIFARGKAHNVRRAEIAAAGIQDAKSTVDKSAIIVILKDRVTPGSERRKVYECVKGATLHVQANECGPFQKSSGSYAQIVTDDKGQRLKPVVNFATLKNGHVVAGGHRAIFDAPTLVIVKGYQDMGKTAISRLTPYAEKGEAWIHDELLCMVNTGDPLSEEHARFTEAYEAMQKRLVATSTEDLHFAC
jgi:hypothetical protein